MGRLMRAALSYFALGVLAFIALFVVLINDENEGGLYAMQDVLLGVSAHTAHLTSTAERMLGSQDLGLRAERLREF